MLGRRVGFLSMVGAVVLSSLVLGSAAGESFFGISGILPDKEPLADLGIGTARYGLYVGPLTASGLEKHVRQMADLVRLGVTPLPTFWLPSSVDDGAVETVRQIVAFFTTGDGARSLGAPVRLWELGNEENGTWATSCSPEEYARRVAPVARGIRGACPECQIVMGGLLDGPALGTWAARRYLEAFLRAGGGAWIDVYAFHVYGLAQPPALSPDAETYLTGEAILASLQDALTQAGLVDRPIWVTETSTYSGRVGEIAQTEEDQAADLVKRFVLYGALGIERVFWTYLTEPRFEGTGEGFFDQAGLIYDGFGPADRGAGVRKRAYDALAALTRRVKGRSPLPPERTDGISLVRYTGESPSLAVLWQDPWIRTGPVYVTAPGPVRVLDLYGEEIGAFEGVFRLDLSLAPVYLEGAASTVSPLAPLLSTPPSGR